MFYTPRGTIGVEAQFWNYVHAQFTLASGAYLLTTLFFAGLNYLFVLQMKRYYEGSTSRGKTIAVGLIAEGPVLFYSSVSLLLLFMSNVYGMVVVPLPIPLLVGLFIMKRFPLPRQDDGWLDSV